MKAKLIKDSDGYWLDISNDVITKRPLTDFGQLSIKNCEAIERGYDVFELAYDSSKEFLIESTHSPSFTFGYEQGFQKALEIRSDKKFSEDDVRKTFVDAFQKCYEVISSGKFDDITSAIEWLTQTNADNYIQSLQKTEWGVEICCYIGNGDKESDSFKDTFVTNTGIPKLDSDGCLILRRI